MSQLGGGTDLPAREKKSHKRKNEPMNKDNADFMQWSIQRKNEAADFVRWSNQQNDTQNKPQINQTPNTNTNDDDDNEAPHSSNTSDLAQQIHEFSINKDNKDTIKASEYLRSLRSQNEEASDSSSSHNTEDPLLTLLRIEAKEKDKPTTIEYDDRVYDKKIFQDEEFKEYRKNNVATAQKRTFLYQDTDKIIHRKPQTHNDTNEMLHNEPELIAYDEDYDDIQQAHNLEQNLATKMKPNFFIALKITDMKLKRKLRNTQQILLKELNDTIYEKAMIEDTTFHITINAIYCADDDEVFYLINEFEKFGKTTLQKLVPTKLSVRLHINGLDHFRQKVLYGHIEDDANKQKLENVYHALHTQLQKAGFVNQQHKFDPHLTIMKLSKIGNQINKKLNIPLAVIEKLNSKYNKSVDFGYQYVNELELLSMIDERNELDSDDYYQCISTIAPAKLR